MVENLLFYSAPGVDDVDMDDVVEMDVDDISFRMNKG